ncbi:TPA: CPBP family intramembrane metalloprotease [Staphylococcus aureus]|nr:CPBP family intramembrane metalloprotease [Staphylococcus aureus]
MIFHILWHSLIGLMFFLTCFPGILLICIRKVPYFKYLTEFHKYILVLIIVLIIDMCLFLSYINIYLSVFVIIITPVIIYITEKSLLFNKNLFDFYNKNSKFILSVLIAYPILEELNFRYFLYNFSLIYHYHYIQYIILSVLTFVFSHFLYQGKSSIIKIFFATMQTLIYLCFRDIFINIIVHKIFNILVFSSQMKKINYSIITK